MTFWIALALVVFGVVKGGWALALILGTGLFEVGQTTWWLRRSRRREIQVGAETLIGKEVEVADECRPYGRIRIRGELWKAHCPEGAARGEKVRITGLQDLTLEVTRA